MTTLQIGPAKFREFIDPAPPQDLWSEHRYGWPLLYERYLKIKDEPDSREWAVINKTARSIIVDDENRLLAQMDYSLDERSRPEIEAALSAIAGCLDKGDCSPLEPAQPVGAWLAGRPQFRRQLQRFARGEKEPLRKISRALEKDIESRYSLRPNKGVTREGKRLVITADAGPFAGHEAELSALIERHWTSPDLALHISWVGAALNPGVKFFFSADGDRGHLHRMHHDFTNITVSSGYAKTLAHEIGHALGFPDHYYTRWDEVACVYVERGNSGDLMSNSHSPGSAVTAAEWSALEQAYR